MEQKEAADILIGMLNKGEFSPEEKEAVTTAIGVLAWTSLAKGRIKAIKAKKERYLKKGI